jgi:hypothetical protein
MRASGTGEITESTELIAGRSSRDVLLVYCVLDNSLGKDLSLPPGVHGSPVQILQYNSLGAAVSRGGHFRDILSLADAKHAISYQKVVESIHRETTTLPMRYGCLMRDENEVVGMLREHSSQFIAAIQQVRGCSEFGMRILLPEESGKDRTDGSPVETGVAEPGCQYSRGGKAYLLARAKHFAGEDRLVQRQKDVLNECLDTFRGTFVKWNSKVSQHRLPVAQAEDNRRCGGQTHNITCLLSLFFLVEVTKEQAFREAFCNLNLTSYLKVIMTGPWPPYNFVPDLQGETL